MKQQQSAAGAMMERIFYLEMAIATLQEQMQRCEQQQQAAPAAWAEQIVQLHQRQQTYRTSKTPTQADTGDASATCVEAIHLSSTLQLQLAMHLDDGSTLQLQ